MEKAFKILVEQYHRMLFYYILSITNDRHVAEDLTQEAFLVAYRRIEIFDETRDFGAWIRGIGRKLVLAQQRKSKRAKFMQMQYVNSALENNFLEANVSSPNLWEERMDALRHCLKKADTGLRKIIELYYVKNFDPRSISALLGKSVEAVRQALYRARTSLKLCIDNEIARARRSI